MRAMTDKLSPEAKEYFRKAGAKGGKKSSSRLTKAERRERAKRAGLASGKARRQK
jgi:hypothetical protein